MIERGHLLIRIHQQRKRELLLVPETGMTFRGPRINAVHQHPSIARQLMNVPKFA